MAALFDVPLLDNGFRTDNRNKVNASGKEFVATDLTQVIEQGGDVIHPIRFLATDILDKYFT